MEDEYGHEDLTGKGSRASPVESSLNSGANCAAFAVRPGRPSRRARKAAEVIHLRIEGWSAAPSGRSFAVRLWPTFIFLRDGREIERVVSPRPEALPPRWSASGRDGIPRRHSARPRRLSVAGCPGGGRPASGMGAGLGDYRQLILSGTAARGSGRLSPPPRAAAGRIPSTTSPGIRLTLVGGPSARRPPHASLSGAPQRAAAGGQFRGSGRMAGLATTITPWPRHPSGLGTWFAYRAAVLADSVLPLSVRVVPTRPCDRCSGNPASALVPRWRGFESGFKGDCASWRLAPSRAAPVTARRGAPVRLAQRIAMATNRCAMPLLAHCRL